MLYVFGRQTFDTEQMTVPEYRLAGSSLHEPRTIGRTRPNGKGGRQGGLLSGASNSRMLHGRALRGRLDGERPQCLRSAHVARRGEIFSGGASISARPSPMLNQPSPRASAIAEPLAGLLCRYPIAFILFMV